MSKYGERQMSNEVAKNEANLPAFLAKAVDTKANHHAELEAQDAEVPRIKLMNPMSNEVADGAEPGKFLVTTDFTQFEEATVYSIAFRHTFTVAFPRNSKDGDGIVGTAFSKEEALEMQKANPGTQINDTHEHIISVPELGLQGARMYLSGTALGSSRKMNTAYLTKYNNVPRHAVKWHMTVERKKNDKGFWFVPKFDALGYVDDEKLFGQLKDLSETFKEAA